MGYIYTVFAPETVDLVAVPSFFRLKTVRVAFISLYGADKVGFSHFTGFDPPTLGDSLNIFKVHGFYSF